MGGQQLDRYEISSKGFILEESINGKALQHSLGDFEVIGAERRDLFVHMILS